MSDPVAGEVAGRAGGPRHWTIDRGVVHHEWNNELEPVLAISSGDSVSYDLEATGERQIFEDSTAESIEYDFDTIYNLSGPVYVEGAEPGDTLEIEIVDLDPGDWGWSWIHPELGLLAGEFPELYLRTFDLRRKTHTTLVPGIEIPLAPFLGVMGNHPDEPSTCSPFPPHKGGGNLDNRYLTKGSTLWLPVWCEGALFSCGDAHAAQGDGEVCVTGLECRMAATLRFTVLKRSISVPQFRTASMAAPYTGRLGYHSTMGLHADLMEGARIAVRGMIDWLVGEHGGLSREDAYVLCSLAGDLKILEVVDLGVWNVSMSMPLEVFMG